MKLKFITILLCLFTVSASFAQKKNKDKKAKKVIFLAPVPKGDSPGVIMEEPPPPADGMIERAVISNSTNEEPPPPQEVIRVERPMAISNSSTYTEKLGQEFEVRQKEQRKARYASYPAGEETFNELVNTRIELPESAKNKGGVLAVSFLVSKEGELSEFRTNGVLGKEFDTEAESVIKSLGNWDPAMDTNQPFDSRVTVKIYFDLEKPQTETLVNGSDQVFAPPPPPADRAIKAKILAKENNTEEVSLIENQELDYEQNPDQKAFFKDGEAELQRFFNKEMIYPYQAHKANVTGTIYFEAIIKKNGQLGSYSIKKGMDIWQCDDNAITAVKKLPGFVPAKIKGKPVNSKIDLEVPCTP